ncbi:MAG: hypothetical protein FWH01_17350, partial [Oscillospiraceae bacterium]|nr:hypothetical protein [Oscillospiraceae bacterium]
MKKTLALILALAMVFALAVPVLSKPDPKPGNPMWDDAYKGMGAPVDPSVSAMSDASGDKITSNAHSGDVDGIYFYWDDNNKSVLDATLLVADFFFDFIKGEVGERSFTVTAKNSNAYWDYEIVEGAGFVLAGADGVSAYKIPRFFMYAQTDKKTGAVVLDKKTGLPVMVKDELKNINMIFISGDWIDVELEIEKVWLDEDGAVFAGDDSIVTFNSPFVLGKQILSTKSIFGTTFSVRENPIDGYRTHESIQSIKLKPGESGKLTFVNQKKWANINIEKVWLAECDCEEDCELAPADLYDGYHIVAAPEDAEAEFEINGEAAALGNNKVKAGDYVVCELDGLLGDYGWELYSDNDIAVSIGLGESYTVVFYNLYSVATPVDDPVIFVDKIWTGAGAADIAELDSYVT